MVFTPQLKKIYHAVEIGKVLKDSWFRGHQKEWNELTPKVFRSEYEEMHRRDFFEHSVIETFKREAPVLEEKTPERNDALGWLLLAQHHGTPTRLLDWSDSVLVALYFAVCDESKWDKDGELWAMLPYSLNHFSVGICEGYDKGDLPIPEHPLLQYLAREGSLRTDKKAEERKKCGVLRVPKYPFAFLPTKNFARMVAQLSTFTIHPVPTKGTTIPQALTEKNQLARYIIPSTAKPELRRDLAALGVTRKTLFPDLDGLSTSIVHDLHDFESEASTVPEPPGYEGEWDG